MKKRQNVAGDDNVLGIIFSSRTAREQWSTNKPFKYWAQSEPEVIKQNYIGAIHE